MRLPVRVWIRLESPASEDFVCALVPRPLGPRALVHESFSLDRNPSVWQDVWFDFPALDSPAPDQSEEKVAADFDRLFAYVLSALLPTLSRAFGGWRVARLEAFLVHQAHQDIAPPSPSSLLSRIYPCPQDRLCLVPISADSSPVLSA